MIQRRDVFAGLAAVLAASPAALAHTPYGQWVVYRKKHLLIGCHRQDPDTYTLAQAVVREFENDLEAARARPARAPRPERLASLLGTDQLDVAILNAMDANEMATGAGRFAPYGKIPLRVIGSHGAYAMVAHARVPDHHAWLMAMAVDSGLAMSLAWPDGIVLDRHPGVRAYIEGVDLAVLQPDTVAPD